MKYIKFGSISVPVIEHFESTNNIGKHPVFNTTYTAEQIAKAYGSLVGEAINDRIGETYRSNAEGAGGNNDCHGMQLVVDPSEPVEVGSLCPSWAADYNCLDEEDVPLDNEQTIQFFNGLDGYMNLLYYRSAFIYAVSYRFPNASSPNMRRMGYILRTVERDTVYNTDHTLNRVSYNFSGGPAWIDIPYINMMNDTDYYIDEIIEDDPSNPFEPSMPTPYVPNVDDTSDLIDLPDDPPLGVTSSGFVNVYNPSTGGLVGLGDVLFPQPSSSQDVATMLLTLCMTLANQNLINYVVDCHVIPVQPEVGASAEIKVGYRLTGINALVVTSDYVNVSCGSLNIQEYYGGFADYSATVSRLWLPFVGFVDVLPEFWQSGTIAVDYKFNIIDGSFMAYVRSASSKSQLNGSVIASYGGNACIHLPLTGVNYANMVSSLIQAGVSAGSGGASAVLGAAYSAANSIAQGGDPQQSNGYNSTTAILGVRTPYLQIERSVPSWSATYRHEKGVPSNFSTLLQNVSGFTIINDIDLTGIPFTESEVEELRTILASGVYF